MRASVADELLVESLPDETKRAIINIYGFWFADSTVYYEDEPTKAEKEERENIKHE